MSSTHISVADGISLVDAHYFRKGMTACYIVVEDGRAAIIDAGTTPTPDLLSAALDALSITPENVMHVILTHAHFDHCAGTAELLRRLPNAVAVAHETAIPHLLDPFDKLWDASASLWGEAFCKEHYGCADKADPKRVVQADGGGAIDLAGRQLDILYTPGHAWHHISIYDSRTGTMFSGDSFGVSYREYDTPDGYALMLPTSPPSQFKPEVMKESIRRMLEFAPKRVCLTHFGVVSDPAAAGQRLIDCIDRSVEVGREVFAGEELQQRQDELAKRLRALYVEIAQGANVEIDREQACKMLDFDAELSAKGILHLLGREAEKAAQA